MAGTALGKNNFGSERTKLTSRIEKDRLAVYIKKHGIDHKTLISDLMLLAMEYPNAFHSYLQFRYDVDKAMIRNERSLITYLRGRQHACVYQRGRSADCCYG